MYVRECIARVSSILFSNPCLLHIPYRLVRPALPQGRLTSVSGPLPTYSL